MRETAQKLHKIMLFLFGVACVVFVSVFGKLHENCIGTVHIWYFVGWNENGLISQLFLFLFLFFLDVVYLYDLPSADRRVLEATKIG